MILILLHCIPSLRSSRERGRDPRRLEISLAKLRSRDGPQVIGFLVLRSIWLEEREAIGIDEGTNGLADALEETGHLVASFQPKHQLRGETFFQCLRNRTIIIRREFHLSKARRSKMRFQSEKHRREGRNNYRSGRICFQGIVPNTNNY